MKITRIETFTKGHLSIVHVRTEDGAEGYGQISPYNADIAAIALHMLGWGVTVRPDWLAGTQRQCSVLD